MSDGEAILAWILFWVFASITTIATFLIVAHHRSRLRAIVLSTAALLLFIGLYFALRLFLNELGL